MRIFCWLILFVSISCSKDTDHSITYLDAYDIPLYFDAKVVSYKYLYTGSRDTIKHQFSISHQSNDTVCWKRTYLNEILRYESVFCISGGRKILKKEVYYSGGEGYLSPGAYTGRIVFLDEIDDGNIYKKVEAKVVFEDSNGFRYISEDESSYVGEVFLSWNDTLRSALKFSYEMENRETSYYVPFLSRNRMTSRGYVYYAKGVGLLKMEVIDDDNDRIDDMNLVSIEIHK